MTHSVRRKKLKTLGADIDQLVQEIVHEESDSDNDILLDELLNEYKSVEESRYGVERKYRKRDARWLDLLYSEFGDDQLNEIEFLHLFRMRREIFFAFVALVKESEGKESKLYADRGGVELHLLVLLKFLGGEGNSNTDIDIGFQLGISTGSVRLYLSRAVEAILKLYPNTVTWPESNERREIAARFEASAGFAGCIGAVDGTLLPLRFKPSCHDCECYKSRKGSYDVAMLLICDDTKRIRWIDLCWPGSTHDNTMWTEQSCFLHPELYFDAGQYLLGDTAFQASDILVPSFRCPPFGRLTRLERKFNKCVSSSRVVVEQGIGRFKQTFQYFYRPRVHITDNAMEGTSNLIKYAMCAATLHNLTLGEPAPPGRSGRQREQYIAGSILEPSMPMGALFC